MRPLLALLLIFLAPLTQGQTLGNSGLSPFGNSSAQEFLPVEEAYQLEVEMPAPHRLRLYWHIADSYYLYQHAFKFKLETARGPAGFKPSFPPALERSDE